MLGRKVLIAAKCHPDEQAVETSVGGKIDFFDVGQNKGIVIARKNFHLMEITYKPE